MLPESLKPEFLIHVADVPGQLQWCNVAHLCPTVNINTANPEDSTYRLHRALSQLHVGVFEHLFWGPCNEDPTIQGTMLGPPIFGNLHGVYPEERRTALSQTDTCYWAC